MWLSQDVDIFWTGSQIHEDHKEDQLKSRSKNQSEPVHSKRTRTREGKEEGES